MTWFGRVKDQVVLRWKTTDHPSRAHPSDVLFANTRDSGAQPKDILQHRRTRAVLA